MKDNDKIYRDENPDSFVIDNPKFILKQIKTYAEIREILYQFDKIFVPNLSYRIENMQEYAEKLYQSSIVYAAVQDDTIGFISFYANDYTLYKAYINQLGVRSEYQNKGIATLLLKKCIEASVDKGMKELKLEVYNNNFAAIRFYQKNGFREESRASKDTIYMIKMLI